MLIFHADTPTVINNNVQNLSRHSLIYGCTPAGPTVNQCWLRTLDQTYYTTTTTYSQISVHSYILLYLCMVERFTKLNFARTGYFLSRKVAIMGSIIDI